MMGDSFYNEGRMIKLFTITKGISSNLLSLILHIGEPHYKWVDKPESADYLVFPTNYEVGHELTDFYIDYFKGKPGDRELALQYEETLIEMSKKLGKKIIIFYFSDLTDEIPVANSIIFRTSILKSNNRQNEFAMPAFKNDLSASYNGYPEYLEWYKKPAIGFRGQTEPLKLKKSISIRNHINLFFNRFNKNAPFKIKKNYGYLARRNAIIFLRKARALNCDFTITTDKDISNETAVQLFRKNLFEHPYNLCVSGFGNYSIRLYEVISAGRIPVFINTDCKLPLEEFINWKEYVVWIEEHEILKISSIIGAFHYQKKGSGFIAHQQKIKKLWTGYLSKEQFFIRIKAYL